MTSLQKFTPTPRLKSNKRRKAEKLKDIHLLDHNLESTEKGPEICTHRFENMDGYEVCQDCGYAYDSPSLFIEQDYTIKLVRNHDTYNWQEYIDLKSQALSGMHVCNSTPKTLLVHDGFRDEVLTALLPCSTWSDVYVILKGIAILPQMNFIPAAYGHPLAMKKWYVECAAYVIYGLEVKVKFNFVLAKCYIAEGRDYSWIPLPQKKPTLYKYEKLWKDALPELGWLSKHNEKVEIKTIKFGK